MSARRARLSTLWLALGSYLVVLPVTHRLSAGPLGLAVLISALLAVPRWQARPRGGQPLDADHAALGGWIVKLAGLAKRRVSRVLVVATMDTAASVWGRTVTLHGADLAKEEPWVLLTHVARQLAAVTLPKTSWRGWLVAGLGLGVGHILPPLAAVVWVFLLGAAAMYASLSATEAWSKAAERRTAELIGALRQSTPEAFAELARRQGLA